MERDIDSICPNCGNKLKQLVGKSECEKCYRTILNDDKGEPVSEKEDDDDMSKYGDMNY